MHKEKELQRVKSTASDQAKKVIFVMVDSLVAESIDEGLEQKELPTLQFLIEHGQYYKDVVSSFPTMSVTIDSSLLTGAYADQHQVPGLTWYSAEDKQLINYGTGPMEVMKQGVNPVLKDALIHLNGTHLNPQLPTIYEDLARLGKKSGSINGLIYRGIVEHHLSIPPWMQGSASLPQSMRVKGPDFLALGALSDPLEGMQELPDGLTHRIGFNNQYSILTANYLIKSHKLPDFLYVYLPDLDKKVHKKGYADVEEVKELDSQLQSLLESFGSNEEALDNAIFVIAGDSGMTRILPGQDNPVIDLSIILKDYKLLRQGDAVTEQTELVLAVNETMAYVYLLKEGKLRDTASLLSSDSRIEFISWKEEDWIYVVQGESRKQLKFKANGELIDPYQQKWSVEQAPEVLDLNINAEHHTLDYGRYPDVLQRLYGAFHSHSGQFLIVTAKPGYELADIHSPTHKGGGGHGAFGHAESLVPLIISGTEERPEHLRIVDLKPFLLKLVTKQ